MNSDGYDKSSVESIYVYSSQLTGKCLEDVSPQVAKATTAANKGDLGSLVEKHYFRHTPPNNHEPDFADAGLELKTTGIVTGKTGPKAKERLVLTMINYETLVEEDWATSTLLSKCRLMLLMFYEYDKDIPVEKRKFLLPPVVLELDHRGRRAPRQQVDFLSKHAFHIPEEDLLTIRRDWELIQAKVRDGKAHELSEGDTFFLGACRKGAGGPKEPLRRQPFSGVKAKARAFCLKQGYVTSILQGHIADNRLLVPGSKKSLEEVTLERFQPFIGRTVESLSLEFGKIRGGPNHKTFKREIANFMLSRDGGTVAELQMANIEMKTVALEKNGKPKESMSFPNFDYMTIVEQTWEESEFFERLERKFLLVVFQKDDQGTERFRGAVYWNMPHHDRVEARRVWEDTRNRILAGITKLPSATESPVAHVRPKAKDGTDKSLTPSGEWHVKKCFWLNRSYIASILAPLLKDEIR
jgi:DNA mismatch repair protein MutH